VRRINPFQFGREGDKAVKVFRFLEFRSDGIPVDARGKLACYIRRDEFENCR